MSRESSQKFLVRLNLNKPAHRKAWEKLQARKDKSYTDMIVSALCMEEQAASSVRDPPMEGTKEAAIRRIIQEELQAIFQSNPMILTKPDREAVIPEDISPSSDEDLNASLNFIDTFL